MPETGTQGDDLPCPPLFEDGNRGLGTILRPEQIDLERGTPRLGITVFDVLPPSAHTER